MQNILYTRVSTNNQGPDSLSVQNEICKNFLTSQNLTINSTFQEIGSAFNGNQKILNFIINKNYNCNLYLLNVSRFSRNIKIGMEMLELAAKRKINIYFIEEGLNSGNKHHHHQIRMKLLESQNESETISNRQINLNKTRVAKGWKFGVAKFGKKSELISGIRKFKCNEKEKRILDFILQARDGISCKSLNTKLKKIKPDADVISFYDKDGETRINYFDKRSTLSFREIADLLNDYDIKKRGRIWTANSVSKAYKSVSKISNVMGNLNLNI